MDEVPKFLSERGFDSIFVTRLWITYAKHYVTGFSFNTMYRIYLYTLRLATLRKNTKSQIQEKGTSEISEDIIIEKFRDNSEGSERMTDSDNHNTRICSSKKNLRYRSTPYSVLQFASRGLLRTENNSDTLDILGCIWSSILKTLRESNNLGLFFGYWTVLYHLFLRFLHDRSSRRVFTRKIIASSFISGFIVQLFYDGISWKTSLYCFIRAVFGLYRLQRNNLSPISLSETASKGIETIVPPSNSILNNIFDTSTMGYVLVNVGIGYCLYYNPDNMESSYQNFLGNLACINRHETKTMLDKDDPQIKSCANYHPPHQSCWRAFWKRIPVVALKVFKVYSSVQLLSLILTGRIWNRSRKGNIDYYYHLLRSVSKSVFKSCLFLSLQIIICAPSPCIHNYLCKTYNHGEQCKLFILLPWILGSFAVAFESSARRSELALYSLWKLLTCYMNTLRNKYVSKEKERLFNRLASALLFGFASCFWIIVKNKDSGLLKKLDRTIILHAFPPHLELKI